MRQSMNRRLMSILLAAMLSAGGCQTVHVIDQDGQPLEGVRVLTQTLSDDGEPQSGPSAVTDAFGNASLPRPLFGPDPVHMTVHKTGYMPLGIEYPPDWYVTVQMQAVGGMTK
jgi:hypothetical protein